MRKRERVSEDFRPIMRERARELRSHMTPAEVLLWSRIKNDQLDGLRFRRQKVIGPYVADFTCPALSLVVEVDGDTHADPEQIRKDKERTAYFEEFGLRVVRFENSDVLKNIDGVLIELLRLSRELRTDPSPPPSPQGTGGREDVARLNDAVGDHA
jgi:very-short-patch-repair endonuclease